MRRYIVGQPKDTGFTLIELTVVIVILGIISSIGSQFILSATDAYYTTQLRSHLVQRGRLSIEQITRELHMALPNAVRISASGDCIEFLPIVTSTSYQNPVPDQSNSMAATNAIPTSAFSNGRGSPKHVIISAFASTEVYTNASPSAKATLGALGSQPYTSIPLSSSHIFVRNSVNRRIYIVDDPIRYCVTGGNLVRYSDFGLLTSAITDSDPGGASDLAAHGVSAISGLNAFFLSPGSEDSNIAVSLNLAFSKGTESIDLKHQVLIRNVP